MVVLLSQGPPEPRGIAGRAQRRDRPTSADDVHLPARGQQSGLPGQRRGRSRRVPQPVLRPVGADPDHGLLTAAGSTQPRVPDGLCRPRAVRDGRDLRRGERGHGSAGAVSLPAGRAAAGRRRSARALRGDDGGVRAVAPGVPGDGDGAGGSAVQAKPKRVPAVWAGAGGGRGGADCRGGRCGG